jgi:hypothetical protein
MPEQPAGEYDLRTLALRFTRAEGTVLALLGLAADGDRRSATIQALKAVAALRLLDLKQPVVSAYLAEHPRGEPTAVRDLAGSLARRLDTAAQVAADSVRASFANVTPDTIDDHVTAAVTAVVDARGTRWSLGRFAEMNTTTIGRQATSRGISDRVGPGRTVTVNTGDCEWCASHAGQAVIGQDSLPPYHPNCSCVAT